MTQGCARRQLGVRHPAGWITTHPPLCDVHTDTNGAGDCGTASLLDRKGIQPGYYRNLCSGRYNFVNPSTDSK